MLSFKKSFFSLCLFIAVAPFAVVLAAEEDSPKGDAQADILQQAIPFIALRNVTGLKDADDYFGDERSAASLGVCDLSYTPVPFTSTKSFKSLARNGYFYIPDAMVDIQSIRRMSADQFLQGLKQSIGKTRPILYIHGYNMSFARSCKQAALFERNLGAANRVMLFSWPSDGALLNYTRDEADVQWSVAPLERVLEQMQLHFGSAGFDVVAHSLGARGLIYALNSLAHEGKKDLPMLNQLVLVAPDVDAGIFKQALPLIRPLVKHLSLYVSANDKPLALSAEVHGYPRLGETGAHLQGLNGLEIIDLSDLAVRSFSGHLYHLYHDDIAADLRLLLNDQRPAEHRPRLNKVADGYWRLAPPGSK